MGAMEALDGLFQAVALNEAHGVEGPAVGILAQAVNRHDPWVLQSPGDFRFEQETLAALRVGRVLALDLLEGNLAMQFFVLGHEHLPQSSFGVQPEDAEARRG
jgi:hypothetical protein